eukprot:3906084-Lingulodinium_polyedra.AAC.1
MMRARGQDGTRPLGPLCQRIAPVFLYHADGTPGDAHPWHSMLMEHVSTAIRNLMPEALRD